MPRYVSESFGAGDQSWLGSAHGIWNGRTEILDISAFTAAVRGNRFSADLGRTLHHRIGDHVVALPLGWFDGERTGALGQLAGQGVVQVMNAAANLLRPLCIAFVTPAVVVLATFAFDWRLALAMLVAAPVAAVVEPAQPSAQSPLSSTAILVGVWMAGALVVFLTYLKNTLSGDLGESLRYRGTPVSDLIVDRLWPTLLLVGTATLLAPSGTAGGGSTPGGGSIGFSGTGRSDSKAGGGDDRKLSASAGQN